MLSFAHDEDSGELAIAVSPLLAKAILMDAGRYAKVSLEELKRKMLKCARDFQFEEATILRDKIKLIEKAT